MYAVTSFDAQIDAHPAWERAGQVSAPVPGAITNGIPTNGAFVYRNLAAVSGLPTDWYLILAFTATDLRVVVAEGINNLATGDAAQVTLARTIPNDSTTTTPAADFSAAWTPYLYGTPGATGTSTATLPATALFQKTLTGALPTTDAWIVVTNTGVSFWTSTGTAVNGVSVGAFDSFVTNDPFPITFADLTTTTAATLSGVTRQPTVTAVGAGNWKVLSPLVAGAAWTKVSGTAGGSGDRFYNNRPVAARRALYTNVDPTTYGGLRGLFRDLLVMNTQDTILPGDTMTINGQTWACAGKGTTTGGLISWINTSAT